MTSPPCLFRDRDFLVLDKPCGIATTAPDGGRCLVDVAKQLDPAAPLLHPSSRLDLPVSGVVVFARNRRAIQHLLAARQAGSYRRSYLAFSEPAELAEEGECRAAIGIDAKRRKLRKVSEHGKPAHTAYRLLARTEAACCWQLAPQTGRTHQLRVHAAAAGCPLLGDVHYGGAKRLVLADGRVVGIERLMLHCAYVSIPSLAGGKILELRAPLPVAMHDLWLAVGGDVGVFAGSAILARSGGGAV